MHGDEQIPLRRDTGVDQQQVETSDQVILRHITKRRLCEFGPIQFSPGLPANEGISSPVCWTKRRATIDALVEHHANRALMLWRVFKHRRLVDDIRQMLWMPRW